MISIGPGLYELHILETLGKGGLRLYSCRTKHEAVGHLVRCLMFDADTDDAKAKVRAIVEDALRHMDEQCPICDAYLVPPQETGYCSAKCQRVAENEDADEVEP